MGRNVILTHYKPMIIKELRIKVHFPLSPQEVLWRRLQKTLHKISKYRSFNKLRYFCFILTCFFRVRKEGAETPKILSYGYNLVTKR